MVDVKAESRWKVVKGMGEGYERAHGQCAWITTVNIAVGYYERGQASTGLVGTRDRPSCRIRTRRDRPLAAVSRSTELSLPFSA